MQSGLVALMALRWNVCTFTLVGLFALAPSQAGAVSLRDLAIENFLIDDGSGVVDPGNEIIAFECTSETTAVITIRFVNPNEGEFDSEVASDDVIDECAGVEGDDDEGDDGEGDDGDGEEDGGDIDDPDAQRRAELVDQLIDFGNTIVPGGFEPNAIGVLNIPPLENAVQPPAGAVNQGAVACQDELNKLRDQLQALKDFQQALFNNVPQPEDIAEEELQEDEEFQRLADARLDAQAFTNARDSVKKQLDERLALIDALTESQNINRQLTEENARTFAGGDPALLLAGRGNDDRIAGVRSAAAKEFAIQVASIAASRGLSQFAKFVNADGLGGLPGSGATSGGIASAAGIGANRLATRNLSRGLAQSRLGGLAGKVVKGARQGLKVGERLDGALDGRRRAQDNQEVRDAILDAGTSLAPGAVNPLELIEAFNAVADELDRVQAAANRGELTAEQAAEAGARIKQQTLSAVLSAISASSIFGGGGLTDGTTIALDGSGATSGGTPAGEALFNFTVDFLGLNNITAFVEESVFGGRFTLGAILFAQRGRLLREHLTLVEAARAADENLVAAEAEFRRRAVNRRLAGRDAQLADIQEALKAKAAEIADKQLECERLAGRQRAQIAQHRPLFNVTKAGPGAHVFSSTFNLAAARVGKGAVNRNQSFSGLLADDRFNFWLSPGVSYHDSSGPNELGGFNLRVSGGASWRFSPALNAGVTASVAHSRLNGAGDNSTAADAMTLGVFTQSPLPGGFTFSTLAAFTLSDIASTVNGVRGATDMNGLTAQVSLAKTYKVAETSISPSFSATYVRTVIGGFTDSAGGVIPAATSERFSVGAGLAASRRISLSASETLTPSISISSFFAGIDVDSETLDDVAANRDTTTTGATLGTGFTFQNAETGLKISANGSLAGLLRDQQAYSIGLNLKLPF